MAEYIVTEHPDFPYEEPKPQELIRCRDCKYWMDIDNGRQKHEMCAQLMPDWFCADGERRPECGE